MTAGGRAPIIVCMMNTTTIDPPGPDRRSAASIIERDAEARVTRRQRTALLPLVGAAITAVIALAAAGALLA
jgi:hypothetical protein